MSADWFRVFGAKPKLGRTFLPAEDQPNANQVAVLSFAAWKRLFGEDAGVIGRTIQLNETPYRVVGVMGPQFRFPAGVDLWVPLGLPANGFTEQNRFNESYLGVARLKPGVSFERASALMNLLTDRLKSSQDGERGIRQGCGLGHVHRADYGFHRWPYQNAVAGVTGRGRICVVDRVFEYCGADAGEVVGTLP